MSRLGFKCDGCGEEFKGRDPAAFVVIDGHDAELCSPCFDDHQEETGVVV